MAGGVSEWERSVDREKFARMDEGDCTRGREHFRKADEVQVSVCREPQDRAKCVYSEVFAY
jgi:hypothetical protein